MPIMFILLAILFVFDVIFVKHKEKYLFGIFLLFAMTSFFEIAYFNDSVLINIFSVLSILFILVCLTFVYKIKINFKMFVLIFLCCFIYGAMSNYNINFTFTFNIDYIIILSMIMCVLFNLNTNQYMVSICSCLIISQVIDFMIFYKQNLFISIFESNIYLYLLVLMSFVCLINLLKKCLITQQIRYKTINYNK